MHYYRRLLWYEHRPFLQIVNLAHIHKYSIVHRDFKPENILITETGHTLLSDFGCAKRLNEPKKEDQTEPNLLPRKCSFVGTSYYVSPEVSFRLKNGEFFFTISDIKWCRGNTCHRLLVARRCNIPASYG